MMKMLDTAERAIKLFVESAEMSAHDAAAQAADEAAAIIFDELPVAAVLAVLTTP